MRSIRLYNMMAYSVLTYVGRILEPPLVVLRSEMNWVQRILATARFSIPHDLAIQLLFAVLGYPTSQFCHTETAFGIELGSRCLFSSSKKFS